MANERVLIVDDDEDLVVALTAALSSAGYQVDSAANGKEGWQKAQAARPELVIVDVIMDTVGEGVELVQRFRGDRQLKAVPIIMLTAVNQELPLHIGAETDESYLPVDVFLEKPIDPNALLKAVAEVLRARRGR